MNVPMLLPVFWVGALWAVCLMLAVVLAALLTGMVVRNSLSKRVRPAVIGATPFMWALSVLFARSVALRAAQLAGDRWWVAELQDGTVASVVIILLVLGMLGWFVALVWGYPQFRVRSGKDD